MRCTYIFKNGEDTLVNNGLTRNNYNLFLKDLKEINNTYNYEIYLVGGYLEYLTMMSDQYNDIDFIIMGEKIIDLYELTDFFKKFHQLAKKYGFVYDLTYMVDANSSDLNTNPKNYALFNLSEVRVIRLYSKKSNSYYNDHLTRFEQIPETELFEGILSSKIVSNQFIDKMRKNGVFQKPLKIS